MLLAILTLTSTIQVFAPVRIGITFVSVPALVRHFRKIGFFKK